MSLFFVAIATAALADAPPSNWPNRFPMGFEKASAPLTHGFRMGPLDIRFEKTTLADIQQAIGVGRIASQGDAGEAVLWLCYTLTDARNVGRLWISASSEMGGPEHLVGGIDAMLDSSAVPTIECPALPSKFLTMSFDHGMWLGMKSGGVISVLGPDHSKQGEWTVYGYLSKPDKDGCELDNYLLFESVSGAVRSIRAGQVTSC